MAHVPSPRMAGPFFHLCGDDGSIYVFCPEKKNAHIGPRKRRRLQKKANEVGVLLDFRHQKTSDGYIVAVLRDGIKVSNMPKKPRQRNFERRANSVMGSLGVVYEPKPRTAAA